MHLFLSLSKIQKKNFMCPIKLSVFTKLFFCRLPFTMLVLQKAVKLVWNLPEVMTVACAFMLVMLMWLTLWSFGAAGVVAANLSEGARWWLLVVSRQVCSLFQY